MMAELTLITMNGVRFYGASEVETLVAERDELQKVVDAFKVAAQDIVVGFGLDANGQGTIDFDDVDALAKVLHQAKGGA